MKQLFVVAGPSGVGKSYLIEQLVKRYPHTMIAPQLYTTRQSRPNEQAIDRAFISLKTFQAMQERHEFAFAEEYDGNWYGYMQAALQPTQMHHIINITPAMVLRFQNNPATVLIGMNIEPDRLQLLRRRLVQRGDTPATVRHRMELIVEDVAGLTANDSLIRSRGAMFMIRDNDSIEPIIKWVVNYMHGSTND